MVFTKQQTETLAKLHGRHLLYAHLYDEPNNAIRVEFEFPYRYIISTDGSYVQETVAPIPHYFSQ